MCFHRHGTALFILHQDMAAEFSIPICDYFNASWWQSGASGEVHGDGEEFKSGVRGMHWRVPSISPQFNTLRIWGTATSG